MIPDLGSYAVYVLGSYAVSLLAIAILIWVSMRRSRKVRAELDRIEERVKRG